MLSNHQVNSAPQGLYWAIIIAIGVCLGVVRASGASTILQISATDLAKNSAFIFEGQVVAKRCELQPDNSIITRIQFQVMDIIKGPAVGATLELIFAGGEVGNRVDFIAGIQYPAVQEHGIYFVQDLDKRYFNPLLGWTQGHFLIKPTLDQQLRIHTARGQAVKEFVPTLFPSVTQKISRGLASGVTHTIIPTQALDVAEFKQRIRILAQP